LGKLRSLVRTRDHEEFGSPWLAELFAIMNRCRRTRAALPENSFSVVSIWRSASRRVGRDEVELARDARLGRRQEAQQEFERAASLTRNGRERTLLLDRAAACAAESAPSSTQGGLGGKAGLIGDVDGGVPVAKRSPSASCTRDL
jgi:hypothetical protein